MKQIILAAYMVLLTLMMSVTPARADQCSGGNCMSPQDMKVFIQLLRDAKCRNETPPKFTLDPVTIVVDNEGRVYGSGAQPVPYKVQMQWCNYEAAGTGEAKLVAAAPIPVEWGFRFRPKFAAGLLPFEVSRRDSWSQSVDVALVADLAYWKALNFNVLLGIRSFGTGIGLDLTKNFGILGGYSNTWGDWKSNLFIGAYFGF